MKTVVGVLRGGPSSEYEVSLRSGAAVLQALHPDRYQPRDIFIDRNGNWHVHGVPVSPEKALRGVEVAFNTLHGEYGEDGRVQRVLETIGVPYTGADAFASALSFNKQRSKDAALEAGLRVPHGVLVEEPADGNIERIAFELFRKFPMPAMVKPLIGGSSVGMTLVTDFQMFEEALLRAFAVAHKAVVEEYIRGKEATVGVIDDFRGERYYALLPIEIIPPASNSFFDYDAKYSGATQEICPGNFTPAQKEELMDAARRMHAALSQSHYSRSDFIVGKRGIYFLETNSAAGVGLTEGSLMPKAVHAVGSSLPHFVEHIVELARARRIT